MSSEIKLGFSYNPNSNNGLNSTEFVTLSDADNGKYFVQATDLGQTKINELGELVKDIKLTLTLRSFENTAELRAKDIQNSAKLLQGYLTRNKYARERYGNVKPSASGNEGYKGQFLYLTLNPHNSLERKFFDVLEGHITLPSNILDKLTGTPIPNIQLVLSVKAIAKGNLASFLPQLIQGDFAVPFHISSTYHNYGYSVAGTGASSQIISVYSPNNDNIYGYRYGKQAVEITSSANNLSFVSPEINNAFIYKYLARISVRFLDGTNPCFSAYLEGYNTVLARYEQLICFFSYDMAENNPNGELRWFDISSDIIQNFSDYSKYRMIVNSNAATGVDIGKKIWINGLGVYQLPTGTLEDNITEFIAVNQTVNDAYVTIYNMRGDAPCGFELQLNDPSVAGAITVNTCYIGGQFVNYEQETPLNKLSLYASRSPETSMATQFWKTKAVQVTNSGALSAINFNFGPSVSPYALYKYDSVPRAYRAFVPIAVSNTTLATGTLVNTLQLKLFGQSKVFDFSFKPLQLPYWTTSEPAITDFRLVDCGEFRVKKNNFQNIDYTQLITDTLNNYLTVNLSNPHAATKIAVGGVILIPCEQSASFSFGLNTSGSGNEVKVISWADSFISQYIEFAILKDTADFGTNSEATGDNLVFVPSPHGENSGTRFDLLILTSRHSTQTYMYGYDASLATHFKISYRPSYQLGI